MGKQNTRTNTDEDVIYDVSCTDTTGSLYHDRRSNGQNFWLLPYHISTLMGPILKKREMNSQCGGIANDFENFFFKMFYGKRGLQAAFFRLV